MNLYVHVYAESPRIWIAQGLSLDFCEQGTSQEEVIQTFHANLQLTLQGASTERHNLVAFLLPAPPSVWKAFYVRRAYSTVKTLPLEVPEALLAAVPYRTLTFLSVPKGN